MYLNVYCNTVSGIRNDMERRGVLIDVEEEEEERRDTEDEEEQGKAKDYESIIVYDSFDDRYYLDDDHSTNKFKSNQNDVGLWPIIDFVNLYLTSKIFNTVYLINIEDRKEVIKV
ncbi:myb-like protein X [Vespula maculifrons]|uniref:Myb-like protein X n=1 Tax=Vespula maculifrons TaxID=7453 RepID=A0ABD2AGZ9_VESMC